MRKYTLFFLLIINLFINNNIYSNELVLYSKDNFKIQSDSFIQDESKNISLTKNSNLNISFTNDNKENSFEDTEPKIDLKIFKNDNKDLVYSLKTPNQKINTEIEGFNQYLEENKTYFEEVFLENDKINIKIPLNFEGGKYDLILTIEIGDKKLNLDYSFNVSNSAYSFTTSDIIIEDTNVLANIGYVSLFDTDQDNKIVVTLTKEGVEIFKKESDKKFFNEGSIIVDENIDALSKLKGEVVLKIDIKDIDGQVILTQSKTVDLKKTNSNNIYYIILGMMIALMVILFFVFKTKISKKVIAGLFLLLLIILALFVSSNISAVETCGGVNKPADTCLEDIKTTSVCQQNESCSTTDARVRKNFSTGNIITTASSPASITVDVCVNMSNLKSNDNFYVISDSATSAWLKKRYHIFSFKKGTASTVTFDPGGRKRNVNYATYDGSCKVIVTSVYKGADSNTMGAKVRVIEAGKIEPSMCKSRVVNTDTYENNSNLLSITTCTNSDGTTSLSDTYIKGSVYMTPVKHPTSSWSDQTVNVCDYLGINPADIPSLKNQNKGFYALMEQTSSWWQIRFPIFEFKFGNVYAKSSSLGASQKYYYGAYKENYPSMSYDGSCNVVFRLYNTGHDTDSWTRGYSLIELGLTSNATCRDPLLVDSSSYKYSGKGLYNGEVEEKTKNDTVIPAYNVLWTFVATSTTYSKYKTIAPFFQSLIVCQSDRTCNLNSVWIESATDNTCEATTTPQQVCSCNNTRTNTCTTGGVATTTTLNSPQCAFNSYCSPTTSLDKTFFTFTPINRIGNVTYTHSPNVSTLKSSPPYTYIYSTTTTPGTPLSLTVNLTDSDGSKSNATCSVENTTALTEIIIKKTPAITLNKGGTCTLDWEIINRPTTGMTCTLSGGDITPESLSGNSGKWISPPIYQNTRYTISCSGDTSTTIVSSSICRVNPTINEI